MQAAMAGVVSDVEELLTNSRLDLQDDMGMTALMWAACSALYPPSKCQNFAEVIKTLLDAKASVNMEDDNGITALMHTLSNGLGIASDPLQEHEVQESKLYALKLMLERRQGLKGLKLEGTALHIQEAAEKAAATPRSGHQSHFCRWPDTSHACSGFWDHNILAVASRSWRRHPCEGAVPFCNDSGFTRAWREGVPLK